MKDRDITGKYEISYLTKDGYKLISNLEFNDLPNTLNFQIPTTDNVTLQIKKIGRGLSFADSILIDGKGPTNVVGNISKKLSVDDLDLLEIGTDGLILNYDNIKTGSATITAFIEKEVIKGIPFLLGADKQNRKIIPQLNYSLGENSGVIEINGEIKNLSMSDVFKVFETSPDSAHPDGKAYIWVYNDESYLYIATDWTSDNTFDYGKDFFEVYIQDGKNLKTYTQYSNRGEYGKSAFGYTNKVTYEHMYYEMAIPLSELNSRDLKLGFELYGTAVIEPEPCLWLEKNPPTSAAFGETVNFEVSYDFQDNQVALLLLDITDFINAGFHEWEISDFLELDESLNVSVVGSEDIVILESVQPVPAETPFTIQHQMSRSGDLYVAIAMICGYYENDMSELDITDLCTTEIVHITITEAEQEIDDSEKETCKTNPDILADNPKCKVSTVGVPDSGVFSPIMISVWTIIAIGALTSTALHLAKKRNI